MPAWIADLTVGQIVVWVGAVVALALAVWRGWPAFRKAVATLSGFVKLVETLSTLPDDIDFIKHELEANSGKSVKDIATRTEQAVDRLTGDVAHVKRQGQALKTSVAKANKALETHIASAAD